MNHKFKKWSKRILYTFIATQMLSHFGDPVFTETIPGTPQAQQIEYCDPHPTTGMFDPCADIYTSTIQDKRNDNTPVIFRWEDDSSTLCVHSICYPTDDIRSKLFGHSRIGA